MNMTETIFFSVILIFPLLLIILKKFKSPSPPLPPGPFSWPIFGNLFQIMGKQPHEALTQLAKTHGPLFSIRLGTQLVVVGSSQEAAMEILKTNDRVLSGRSVPHAVPSAIFKLEGASVAWSAECNERWKFLRGMCKTELFSRKALDSQAGAREKMILDMVNFVKKMEGKVVNIRQIAFASIFNMIGNALLSRDVISMEHESVQGEISGPLREMLEVVTSPNVSDLFPVLGRFDVQGLQRKCGEWFRKNCKIWEDMFNERRCKIKGCDDALGPSDFLDVMIKNGSSNVEINVLFQELFSAGTDTSSSTMEWVMAELIKHPKYMKKVQEEIKRETRNGEDAIKESQLPQLTFLQACFKEALRLHAPGPLLIPHRAVESCQVMNYTIPKNAQVMVNYWAIGRDPKIWEDPLVFKPERFLNSSSLDYKGNDFEYIPFSSGRRICPGLPMASMQVPLVVANLVHFFEWCLPDGENPHDLDMNEQFGLTMMKEQPLLLIPKANK